MFILLFWFDCFLLLIKIISCLLIRCDLNINFNRTFHVQIKSDFLVTRIFLHFIHSFFVYLYAIICNKNCKRYIKINIELWFVAFFAVALFFLV